MSEPTRITLERPLTNEELRELTGNGENHLQAVIRVDVDDLIANDMEWLNDIANEQVLPKGFTCGLMDFAYNVVGCEPASTPLAWGAGSVLLHVSADASESIEVSEEEPSDG